MTDRKITINSVSHPLMQDIEQTLWNELTVAQMCVISRFYAGEDICSPECQAQGLRILLQGSATAYTPHPTKKGSRSAFFTL